MFAVVRVVWALFLVACGLLLGYKSWKSKQSQVLRFAGIFFGGLILIVALAALTPQESSTVAPAGGTIPDQAAQQAAAFKAMSSAEHLALAQKSIRKDSTAEELFEGRRHANAIDATAAEFKMSRSLLAVADQRQKILEKEELKRSLAAEIERNPVLVLKSDWATDGFGTVAVWHVTFKNRSTRPVGNITYRTVYTSETGAVVDKGGVDSLLGSDSKKIQRVIGPGQTRTLEINDGFVNTQAHRASFTLVGWEYVQDGR